MDFERLEDNMFKGHYKGLRGRVQELKSAESGMKYVGSKFFPRIVITLWSSANE
jgi:hypothetical protein